ncbi:Homoserine/homoserine lactone efflux protein [Roseobacter fucihabitans]|uniref:Homoserine/homoserine lactone efflux protein n=1 Tax=Roseobacter fucihabitans TaxID=1537242 RepID=A0ABZ2BP04_9RHOB|nr:LysE family translocator [Roseobacter litoralis]MBC6964699.1 Homoserine/homoserine lactone efflux protein [Roseobacter litoralis]
MIAPDVMIVFITASVALALAPGPDNIFVLTQSALHGRVAGIMVTLGLCLGVLVHTSLVALGVAVIFQTSALSFAVLKTVGGCYLLYLAWKAFGARPAVINGGRGAGLSPIRLIGRGVIMNVTNPKVAIFFLAFLPQFADPARGPVTPQIFIFGGVFVLSALVVFGAIAWSAGFLGAWLARTPRAQVVMNRIAGGIFAALALRLFLAQR